MLTGDFNCDDGYEQSKPVLYLKGELDNSPITFDDTFRSYNGDGADGTTFPGKPGDILLLRLELETNVIRRFAKVSIVSYNRLSVMIIALVSQFHVYLPWGQRPFSIVS